MYPQTADWIRMALVERKSERDREIAAWRGATDSTEVIGAGAAIGAAAAEVRAHFALHLIYSVEVLSDDTPRLVGVGIVANDLQGDHG
jgi:hypothetical protein